eukprot:scaffold15719_cov63-Phaeocystis_antarctica.AAC.3
MVRGWRGGMHKNEPMRSLRRRASAAAATPGSLGGGGGRAARLPARAAANGFDHLARPQQYVPSLLTQKQIQKWSKVDVAALRRRRLRARRRLACSSRWA